MLPLLKDVFQDIERLEAFPRVAVAVLEASLQEETTAGDIVRLVETDAAITAKVIRLANSAAHAGHAGVHSLHEACVKLGVRAVASLVLSTSANSLYAGLGSSTPRSNHTLWQESLTNALSARLLAERRRYPDPERAYTVGLLQNVAHVVMDRFLARERDDVLSIVDDGGDMLAAEKTVFGMHHAQIGGRILRKWDFPDVLVDGVLHHHAPEKARVDWRLCAICHQAEGLAWSILGDGGTEALVYGMTGRTTHMGTREDLPEADELRGIVVEQRAELEGLFG